MNNDQKLCEHIIAVVKSALDAVAYTRRAMTLLFLPIGVIFRDTWVRVPPRFEVGVPYPHFLQAATAVGRVIFGASGRVGCALYHGDVF